MELPPTHQSWPRTSAQGILPIFGQQTTVHPQAQISIPWTLLCGFFWRGRQQHSPSQCGILKASIIATWANISTDFIKKSCAAFRHRVDAAIEAKGGYIE
ncbi:Transposable element tcb2 transposase [Caligus rogercresseyi]|uniref:Transposable element tcb2 transposase n=1 Tax=Caligus rogercresseyi TaxID=217165 RepID=A0A7T8H1D4_CALRO|nr:Transposable element tcb2 transposase [Caligus rogercresseyi]